MSVEIVKQGGQIYVNAKPDNAKPGSLGAAGVHIPCKDQEEADKVAKQFKDAEAIQKATLQEGQGEKLDVTSQTPPTPPVQPEAKKLDVAA